MPTRTFKPGDHVRYSGERIYALKINLRHIVHRYGRDMILMTPEDTFEKDGIE